ncbi:WD repeat and SOF domain-containing protein 1 [Strigomonas culicis]|nr:WD repeat and SOF domain-containing protein 1 [Strigomonas culicis]|eukprot:EPY35617.1 WD repeat and SOF domain-containing protein 1 [Strigomonas culicis]
MAKQVEFTRAVKAAKLDRMFAKPFVASLAGHQDTIQCIATDNTSLSTVVTGAVDGGLVIWDVMTKRAKVQIDAHRHSIDGVTISPDGVACFSASRDKVVKMWDLDVGTDKTPEPVAEYLGDFPFSSIDHHYHKSNFVTASDIVSVWDVNRTQPLQKFSWGDETVTCCRYNKVETDLVACCMADRGVFLYDTRTQSAHSKIVLEMRSTSVCWNPMDPNVFVTGCDDRNCYLFDIRLPGRPRNVFQGHIKSVASVDFAPTGYKFAAGSQDCTVRMWDINQNTKSESQEMYHTKRMSRVLAVKWSPDNSYIYSGSEDCNLRIWKADASKPVRPFRGPEKHNFDYMRKLKDKYSNFTEVKRITKQRNTPKHLKKQSQRMKKAGKRDLVKEMTRKRSENVAPLTKRKTYEYVD